MPIPQLRCHNTRNSFGFTITRHFIPPDDSYDGNGTWITGIGDVCDTCLSEYFWSCADCDAWYHAADAQSVDDLCSDCWSDRYGDSADDDSYDGCTCGSCYTDRNESAGSLVRDYSYKPRPVFHGTGPVFLGAELEISTYGANTRKAAELATRHLGSFGYLKSDSSIGTGFEIVTHPFTYAWGLDHYPWAMLDDLRDMGCEASESCGMHVHVSRAGFANPAHMYRWMKFVYRNQHAVQAIARRESTQWASFDRYERQNIIYRCKPELFRRGYDRYGYPMQLPYPNRYVAINTLPEQTVEMRVFASTLNATEVQAALGLADASVEYTRRLSAHEIVKSNGWAWQAFTAWLSDRTEYAPLLAESTRLVSTR